VVSFIVNKLATHDADNSPPQHKLKRILLGSVQNLLETPLTGAVTESLDSKVLLNILSWILDPDQGM
jgi:hypothetical protein